MNGNPLHSSDEWEVIFRDLEALRYFSGDGRTEHPVLASRLHTNQYFGSDAIFTYPAVLAQVAEDLSRRVEEHRFSRIDLVVGPAFGVIPLAIFMADRLGIRFGAYRRDIDAFEYCKVREGDNVLVVEDVITTGGTVRSLIKSLESLSASVLDIIVVIVNRSGSLTLANRQIESLIELDAPLWSADRCPLCKKSSPAVRM